MSSDLTQGTIWKKLLLFAIPLLLSSLVQQLYNTVDLIFVGNYLGKAESSAIGASSLLITCLVVFFSGISVGSGIVTAQIFGSGDRLKLKKSIHNALALSMMGGVILMIAGYFMAPIFLVLLKTPKVLHADAVSYLRIYFLSFIFVTTYNIGAGVLWALGDSKSPLFAQFTGGLVNVAMDAVFVVLFENGINGVAWATLFSQSVAAFYVVYRLTRLDCRYALCLKDIRFDKDILFKALRIGLPSGTQSLVITLSNVMVQYQINSLGVDAIAAFTAYFKVELVIYLPIVAFGQAVMTFSGQNTGAGDYMRVRKGTGICLLMAISLTAISSAFALYFGRQLFRAFTTEPEVIELGLQIIQVSFPFYFIYVVLQLLGDSIRGSGKANPPMLIILVNICIIRTVLLFILVPRYQNIQSVAVTYPLTWLLTAIIMTIYYLHYHKGLRYKNRAVAEGTESTA